MNNKPLLHKDSYEPVSMMECHMRVLNITQLRCFPSFCHGSKRKKLWTIPWHRKFLLEISHSCHDKLSFFMPQNHRQPLCQFHVWHPQRCKNSAPEKNPLIRVAYHNAQGLIGIFVWIEEAFGGIRICKTAWKLVIRIYYKMLYGFKSAGKCMIFGHIDCKYIHFMKYSKHLVMCIR